MSQTPGGGSVNRRVSERSFIELLYKKKKPFLG